MAFTSDTPVRSFFKCTKDHGDYKACERCTIPGELLRIGTNSKIIYPSIGYPMRTKESFFIQEDLEHYVSISPLINIVLEIDFTKVFILDHIFGFIF